MNVPLFSLMLLLGTCPFIYAQDVFGVPEGSRRENGRKAWFIQTSIPDGLENPIKVSAKGKIELVTLSNRLASGPVEIPDDGVVRFLREIPNAVDPAKPTHLILAETKIPEQVRHALVVLIPVPAAAADGRVFRAVARDLNGFNGGDCLYINLTEFNFAVEIGDAKVPLKPGATQYYRGGNSRGPVTLPFRYSYHLEEKKQWKVLSASINIMSPTRREIVIFSGEKASGRVRCVNITFPLPVEDPKTAD